VSKIYRLLHDSDHGFSPSKRENGAKGAPMFSRPRVLICTDFSSYADQALITAHRLASKTGGSLHLIHVAELNFYLEEGPYGIKPQVLHEDFLKELKRDLSERMHDQIQRCEVQAQQHIIVGKTVYEGMFSTIKSEKIDLVVMGYKGNKSSDLFHVGSLTTKLASSLPVPLLVVKDLLEMDRIAGLADVTGHAKDVVQTASELSFILPSKLSIVSLHQDFPGLYASQYQEWMGALVKASKEDTDKAINNTHARLKDFLGSVEAEIIVEPTREKSVALHLLEILHDGGYELAVMKRHNKSTLERYLLGSETRKVLDLFRGNLLILPPKKDE
jgi:nucleotide-binding universal stress UspA family protein